MAMRYVCFGAVEIRIRRRNLDAAVLPSGSEKSHRRGISRSCAIDLKAVIVETNHERRGGYGPRAVRALGHIESFSDPNSYALRVRRNNAKRRAIVRIHARVLRLGNIKR